MPGFFIEQKMQNYYSSMDHLRANHFIEFLLIHEKNESTVKLSVSLFDICLDFIDMCCSKYVAL